MILEFEEGFPFESRCFARKFSFTTAGTGEFKRSLFFSIDTQAAKYTRKREVYVEPSLCAILKCNFTKIWSWVGREFAIDFSFF